jgi:8-oxo-dGTP diphosphatase
MINVTCGIILKDGKVLVTQRSETMQLALKWEFPGGKIEAGETEEQCLCRELKEELGIEIEILEKLESKPFDYGKLSINLIPFVANHLSGEIMLHEHKDFKWLTKEELPELEWASADIPVLDAFLKSNYGS